MRVFLKAPTCTLVAAVALLAACNKAPRDTATRHARRDSAAPVVATVNGVALTRPEFDIYEKNLLRNAKVQSLTPDQQNQVLDDLITMQIMAAQAEKDGLKTSRIRKAQLSLLHMRVMADAESQKFVKSHPPTDAELHAEYDTAIAQMDKTEYHARHILVGQQGTGGANHQEAQGRREIRGSGEGAIHGHAAPRTTAAISAGSRPRAWSSRSPMR